MRGRDKKITRRFSYAMIAALVVANANFPGNMTVYAKTQNNKLADKDRIYGANRYDTAAKVSEYGWDTSDYVILANGENFADALCAAPLAKKYNAPILLTPGTELNDSTLKEIKRLKASHIFIIGKYGAVSKDSETQLTGINAQGEINIEVTRLGGNDRYETSLEVAKALGSVNKVALASGEGYADALSVASVAAALTDKDNSMAILLTAKDKLPDSIKNYLSDNKVKISDTFVIGGIGAITKEAASAIENSYVRLWGTDRYETNVNVMGYFFSKSKFDKFYIVQADGPRGDEFADALSGAALASITSSPIVLTYKTLSEATKEFINGAAAKGAKSIAVGGEAVVPKELLQSVSDIIIKAVGQISELPIDPNNPGGAATGTEAGTGTGAGAGTANSGEIIAQLTSVRDKLNSISSLFTNQKMQEAVSLIQASLSKAIANPSYDITSDEIAIISKLSELTQQELDTFKSILRNNIDATTRSNLKKFYGL